MNTITAYVTHPFQQAMGQACDLVPFSVAEGFWLLFVAGCMWYVGHAVFLLIRRRGERLATALQKLLGACVIGLSVALGFTLLWGTNYYAASFEERTGIEDAPVSVEQLAAVTRLFAEKVNESADAVPRDAQGVFCEDRETLFAESRDLYTNLEKTYPFLQAPHTTPKPIWCSWFMSRINYTGFFFPLTGEANLNYDQPRCFLPSTLAHELAHVRGVAPEQTANFVAILACEQSGQPDFVYSGYLMGYLHLSNALYMADREAWEVCNQQLCAQAHADLADNNAYWARYQTHAAKVANSVYTGFLESYDQELGLRSYGAVVDYLVAYYGAEAAEH